jgi:hypothetical protein
LRAHTFILKRSIKTSSKRFVFTFELLTYNAKNKHFFKKFKIVENNSNIKYDFSNLIFKSKPPSWIQAQDQDSKLFKNTGSESVCNEGYWKGWALKIETFLGPQMAMSKAIAIWAQKITSHFLGQFASIFVLRNGIQSCFLFRRRIRNGIPRFFGLRNSRNSV